MKRRRLSIPALVAGLLAALPAAVAPPPAPGGEVPSSPSEATPHGARAFGIVLGADGEPLAGVEARLRPARGANPFAALPELPPEHVGTLTATSDGEGRFAFEHLPPGRYDLHLAAAGGHAPLRVFGLQVPAAGERDLGSYLLPAGVEVFGRAIDVEGRPLRSVKVEAFVSDAPGGGGRAQVAWDSSGPEGQFSLRDLATGTTVDLWFRAEGFAHAELQMTVPPDEPLVVVLERAAIVAGRVVDGSGAGVAGATVSVESEAGTHGMATRDDGSFVDGTVSPGTVRLQASAEGLRTTEPTVLDVAAGERRDGVRLVLEPGGTVAGRVTGPNGEPIAGAVVRTRGHWPHGPLEARTDEAGRYRIGGLPLGTVAVRADHPDHVEASGEATIEPAGAGSAEVQLDLVLRQGLSVSGRVIDERGEPVAGAEVSLLDDPRYGPAKPVATAEDGSFRVTGLSPGFWRPQVAKEGLTQADPHARVEVTGPLSGLELRMVRGAVIAGRVRGLERSEIPRVRMTAAPLSHPGPWLSGHLDDEGGYSIDGAGPGAWRVTATVPGGGSVGDQRYAAGEVELAAGEREARLDLDLSGRVVLGGRVTLGGEPVAGAMVMVGGLEPSRVVMTRTGADGGFRVPRLAPGRHSLTVVGLDPAFRHVLEVDLDGDHEVPIELVESEVAGRVVDAETGATLGGATVELSPASASGAQAANTDVDGRFLLPRVAPGDYLLHVERDGYARGHRELTVGPEGIEGLEVALAPAGEVVIEEDASPEP